MNKRIISTIIILLLIFAAFVSINSPQLNSIALYVAIPLAFGLSIIQYGNPLSNNRYMQWLLVLYCWIGITYFGAYNQVVALAQMKQILGVVLLSSVMANVSKNQKAIPWLYVVFICLFMSAVHYANTNLVNILGKDERATDDVLNANTLAYYVFYFSCAIYALGECVNNARLRKVMRYMFFSVIFISVWIALITASRQVLVIQVPLFCILLYIRYGFGKGKWLFFFIIGAVLIWSFSTNTLETIFEGTLLQERYEIELEDDQRTLVLREAIEVGNNHPIIGIGPGNFVLQSRFHIFSHCTYTELYANSGFLAALIFIWVVANFIIKQFKRYRKSKDTMYLFFMAFGIFFAVDNFVYVFYAQLWLMAFFVLVASHSEKYYRLQQQSRTSTK
ncbi:MAG: hypothetical protein J6K81_04100 [Rikenellaceae bacterium]|nr:hypothetical protein [Rikenellaceae bacterium]